LNSTVYLDYLRMDRSYEWIADLKAIIIFLYKDKPIEFISHCVLSSFYLKCIQSFLFLQLRDGCAI